MAHSALDLYSFPAAAASAADTHTYESLVSRYGAPLMLLDCTSFS